MLWPINIGSWKIIMPKDHFAASVISGFANITVAVENLSVATRRSTAVLIPAWREVTASKVFLVIKLKLSKFLAVINSKQKSFWILNEKVEDIFLRRLLAVSWKTHIHSTFLYKKSSCSFKLYFSFNIGREKSKYFLSCNYSCFWGS